MNPLVKLDSNQAKTFKEHHVIINNIIKTAMLEYYEIFNVKNVVEMTLLFSFLDIDTESVCAQTLNKVGGWRCVDCIKNENTIFCQDCWSTMKDAHKDHNIVFCSTVNGTCDCGDPNTIDPKYFCKRHKGPMTKDEDIDKYVKKCLREDIVIGLREINGHVIQEMGKYIIRAFQEKQTHETQFKDDVLSFINFISMPCSSSKACLHIIAELLLMNIPFKTKHTCISLKEGENGKLIQSSFFAHECTCPFIRLLMSVWPIGQEKVLYSFLHNYKLRKTMGLVYFLLYGDLAKKGLGDFNELSVQIIFDDVCFTASKIEGLIDNIYASMPEVVNLFFSTKNDGFIDNPEHIPLIDSFNLLYFAKKENKKFALLQELAYRLKYDTTYLFKITCTKYIGSRESIYTHMIDILALMQNVNPVKSIYPHPVFKGEGYNSDLMDAELAFLDIFSSLVSLLDFSNQQMVKNIFQYFSKKIYKKAYKQLDTNEYSFHITLFRGFSIFLNRYCFYYANKNKTQILDGLNSAVGLMSNHHECFKIMIKSVYKIFGFITACGEGFFNYYGEDMVKYEPIYYFQKEFIFRDFCLMKYLLTLKENNDYFGFDNILQFSQVEDSNIPFEKNILKGEKMIPPSQWLNEQNKIYMRFTGKILRIILNILRNNTCLIWNLSSSYYIIKNNKLDDTLVREIINKDSDNFLQLTQELIINETVIRENLAFFSDIYDNIFLAIKEFLGQKTINKLILSMTNKTLTQEKKAKFSLKDEYLKYLDLNYINYSRYKSKVEKYITDFKKNQITIFNTHFYPVNSFEKKLTTVDYQQIYFHEENFDFIFGLTANILEKEKYFPLQEYMLSVLLNYLATFFCLEENSIIFFRENVKNKTAGLVKVLEQNSLTDEVMKAYCHFIAQKIGEHDKIYFISKKKSDEEPSTNSNNNNINTNQINSQNNINENKGGDISGSGVNVVPPKKSSKISMKEKMKNKFKKKNDDMSDKYGLEKIKLEKKKNLEACIYCLKPIETDNINKPYGKIGDFICDNYLSNAFFQVIKKEYKKYYDKDMKLKDFNHIYYQPTERKNIRIISCNHYIHFSCHFEAFMKSDLSNSLNIFQCPLCNKISETFIPMLDQYTPEETLGVFNGYNINNVMIKGKKKSQYYEEIEKKLEAKSQEILKEEEDEKENKDKDKNKDKEKKEDDSSSSHVKKEELFDIIKNAEEEQKRIEEEKKKQEEDEKDNINNNNSEPALPALNDDENNGNRINEDNNINSIIEVEEEKKNYSDFREKYPDFVNACKHIVEGFFGMKLQVGSVNLENDLFKSLLKPFLIFCSIQYRDFLDFFINTDDKKTASNLWKNLSLSLRLLLKLKIIDEEFFFSYFYILVDNFKNLTFEKDLEFVVKFDNMRLILSELLFFFVLLFDYQSIEGYEKYVIYMTLPVFGFGYFYKDIYIKNSFLFNKEKFIEMMTEQNLYSFLNQNENLSNIIIHVVKQIFITKLLIKNNEQDIDKISLDLNDMLDQINLSQYKNKTFLEILSLIDNEIFSSNEQEDKNNNIRKIFKPVLNYKEIFLKLISEHKKIIEEGKCDAILNPSLFGSCLPIIYSFINLPELAIDFEYDAYPKQCEVCGAKGKNSLICLDCGRKVCDSRKCLTKGGSPGFIDHCKRCGGGRVAFLQTSDCSVLFVSNRVVFKKFIPFYVNEFGEGITKTKFGKEFKLCREEVDKALKMFTKYSYSNAQIIP